MGDNIGLKPNILRVLQAVERGEIQRIYGRAGSKFRAPDGISNLSCWKAHRSNLIQDGSDRRVAVNTTVTMVLTADGRKALTGGSR
jgi:hypothetical protein